MCYIICELPVNGVETVCTNNSYCQSVAFFTSCTCSVLILCQLCYYCFDYMFNGWMYVCIY